MALQGVLILFVVQLILTVVLALLQPKPKFEQLRGKGLGEFQFPTATEDRMVPIVWGTVDIRGPNVTWYGDLRTFKVTKEVKAGLFSTKDLVTAIRYFVGMDLLLCYGPIDRVTRLEVSDKEAFTGSISPSTSPDGVVQFIDNVKLLGGTNRGGGIQGDFRIYGGVEDQNRSVYLQGQLGADIPSYVGIAHVVGEQTFVGESPNIGAYIWRVSRFPDKLGLTGDGHIIRGVAGTPVGIEDGDANPAEVLYEILTNTTFGLEIPLGNINFASFVSAGNQLKIEENGWSSVIDAKISGIDMLKEVLRQIDGVLYEDSSGTFTLKLARDDYVLASQPLFDESNVVELESFTRTAWSNTQNDIAIGYSDRTKNYISTTAVAQDTANIRTQGKVLRADQNYPGVKHPTTAQEIAGRELATLSFPLASVNLLTNREGASLVPADIIRFSWAQYDLVDFPLRILNVDLGTIEDGTVKLTCVQDIFRSAETATLMAAPIVSGWSPLDDAAEQLTIELIREAPRIMLAMSPNFTNNDSEGARAWALGAAPNSVQLFFDMWVDTVDGAGYQGAAGTTGGMTPSGLLDATYPRGTADIDTSAQFTMDNAIDLVDGSPAAEDVGSILVDRNAGEIRQGLNLALVQGATPGDDEIIGYEQIIDNGDGTFSLQNVHRALFDTTAKEHAVSARVWFFSGEASALSTDIFGDTQGPTNWKYLTQTTTDALTLTQDTTPLALTFDQRTRRPHTPANFIAAGISGTARLPAAVDIEMNTSPDQLALTWLHRLSTDIFAEDKNVASSGSQDTDIEYVLSFRHAFTAALLRTQVLNDGGTWLAYNWLAADAQSDTGEVGDFPLELSVQARRKSGAPVDPNLTSLQSEVGAFNVDILGAALRSIDLNGTDELLANTSTAILPMANNFTINAWVQPAVNIGGTQRCILVLSNGGSTVNRVELSIADDDAGDPFRIRLWDSTGTLFKNYRFSGYTNNAFNMVTITWAGSTLRVYKNGVEDVSPTLDLDDAGTMTNTSRDILIGVDDTGGARFWQGLIHKVSQWNVTIVGAAITELFNSGSGSTFNERKNGTNYLSAADLKHHWDFRKTGDTTLGQDYGHQASNLRNITNNAQNITAAGDLSTTVPT